LLYPAELRPQWLIINELMRFLKAFKKPFVTRFCNPNRIEGRIL